MRISKLFWSVLGCLAFSAGVAAAEQFRVAPQLPDPAIVVDGDLSDWRNEPGIMRFNSAKQVYVKSRDWSEKTLSGFAYIGWRYEGLYLGVNVVDETLRIGHDAGRAYMYDHVELYLDMTPDFQIERDYMGSGQYSLLLLPPVTADGKAALQVVHPKDKSFEGCLIASQRTPQGYTLEVFIPSQFFGIKIMGPNIPFKAEIALSDTDSATPTQELFMLSGTPKYWSTVRRNLLADYYTGDATGKVVVPSQDIPVCKEEVAVAPRQTRKFTFEMPEVPAGKSPVLHFQARCQPGQPVKKVYHAGFALRSMYVKCNGKILTAKELITRKAEGITRNGRTRIFIGNDGTINLPWAWEFVKMNEDPQHGLVDFKRQCEFEFDLSGIAKVGKNEVEFYGYDAASAKRDYRLADIMLKLAFVPPKAAPRPAPTGKIPEFAPQAVPAEKVYTFNADPAKFLINVRTNGSTFTVRSRFMTEDGKWRYNADGGKYYTLKRSFKTVNEGIFVTDEIVNTSNKDLPLKFAYEIDFGKTLKAVNLCGYEPYQQTGNNQSPMNPTSFGSNGKSGIGFLPYSDAFTTHCVNYAQKGVIGISDYNMVIAKGATHKIEYLIVPVPQGRFWDFINATRRIIGSNYTLKYLFGFTYNRSNPPSAFTKSLVDRSANIKKCNFLAGHNLWPKYVMKNGKKSDHWGTAAQRVDQTGNILLMQYIKEKYPHITRALYFHVYLDPSDNAMTDYAKSLARNPDGSVMHMGNNGPMYIPYIGSQRAKDLEKGLDMIFDRIGCQGVYWDEVALDRYSYSNDYWDGVSGDISGDGKLLRKKSSARLMSLPWRLQMVKKIYARGGGLVCNSNFMPRHAAANHIQNFVETAAISNCNLTLLCAPVALGDHITERTGIDAYKWMINALDFGCLYSYYHDRLEAYYPTLAEHMFPATPVELGKGYIFCKERIITKVSGYWGWGDNSEFDVYVYDANGKLLPDFKAPKVVRNGKNYVELRLPEDYSAAIVRK